MPTRYEEIKCLSYMTKTIRQVKKYERKRTRLYEWYEGIGNNLIDFPFSKEEKTDKISEQQVDDFLKEINKLVAKLKTVKISQLDKNLHIFSKLLGLTKLEENFIGFFIRVNSNDALEEFCDCFFPGHNCWEKPDNLIDLLSVSKTELFTAIRPDGTLRKLNILDNSTYRDRLELDHWVVNLLSSNIKSEDDLIKLIVGEQLGAKLTLEQFNHIPNREKIVKLLKNAVSRKQRGVNILFYGDPGTGKTEFAKVIAHVAGLKIYAVGEKANRSHYHTSVTEDRVNQLQLANLLLKANQKCALLLDEAEDIFSRTPFQEKSPISKIALNKLLETNKNPTIWITNDIYSMDPAHLRRFTYVAEFEAPSVFVRKRMWGDKFKEHGFDCDDNTLDKLAKDFKVSPSFIDNAVKSAKLVNGDLEEVKEQLKEMEKAYRHGKIPTVHHTNLIPFDSKLLNTDVNLEEMAQRIKSLRRYDFSLCLYGAPGTGKTAFSRYIAETLGLEVIQKRASDIMSPYVGATEANIAKAFEEAKREKAVLVFDEADSFLQDRREAHHSWEISQVNEMLTCMEQYPYPFICTTNLMDKLDAASLRRFTYKVKYGFLRPEQVQLAFKDFFNIDVDSFEELNRLTPGDFAVVRKKAEITNQMTAEKLIEMLKMEQSYKEPASYKIGFV